MGGNCADLANDDKCFNNNVAKNCGLCEGMIPKLSNTCYDLFGNCAQQAERNCYHTNIANNCQKSCGLCAGMTPHPSNTCYDMYNNCEDLCKWDPREEVKEMCKKSC